MMKTMWREGRRGSAALFPRTAPPGSRPAAHHHLHSPLGWVNAHVWQAWGTSLRSRTTRAEEKNVTGGCISAGDLIEITDKMIKNETIE